MASKLLKTDINVSKALREAKTGDKIYLEIADSASFNDVQKMVTVYTTKLKIKVRQDSLKGLTNKDEVYRISRIEVIEK